VLKLIIGALIVLFVILELSPTFAKTALDRKWLPLGGVISGFFGGLSGHQGAFRSMFLIKAGLEKETFVATGVVLAVYGGYRPNGYLRCRYFDSRRCC
jgi:uncharacterized protein